MKVGDHPKPGRREDACSCMYPIAAMATYERPGYLSKTVDSFVKTTEGRIPLIVFDDGSLSDAKMDELNDVQGKGVAIVRFKHRGFLDTWVEALSMIRSDVTGMISGHDSLIMLEDDITFAEGWDYTLHDMQQGIVEMGFRQGMTSCFLPTPILQNKVVKLRDVEAYQSLSHSWHCNMMPLDVLDDFEVVLEAAESVNKGTRGYGLDLYYVGFLAHRLNRISFVSTSSWVRHEGCSNSLVKGRGYRCLDHPGYNLVKELRPKRKKKEVSNDKDKKKSSPKGRSASKVARTEG